MAENVLSRKQEPWMSVSTAPDVCKTPMGGSTPPVPYNVVSKLAPAVDASPDVNANDGQVQKHDETVMPTTEGDEPGTAKGVASGTVGQQSWSEEHSPNVNVNSKPVVRHDDATQMNGDKKAQDKEAKKARVKCRKEQIAAAKASDDPDMQKTGSDFERDNKAAEKAALSEHVYEPNKPAPEGWRDISSDKDALKSHGMTEDGLNGTRPGGTRMYEPDPDVFGDDQRTTAVFKGTENGDDWKANAAQAANMESTYYRDSVRIGNELGNSVDYAGHSLGGGLASAASRAGGGPGTTFNAAGLNSRTVSGYGGKMNASAIDAYNVDGDPLTSAQHATSWVTPQAAGTSRTVAATSDTKLGKHGMDDVKKGIEKKKQAAQAKIAEKTGKKC